MTLAMVFPGQGSQSIGMMSGFDNSAIVQQIYKDASDVLDFDLWDLVQNGETDKLSSTEITQPAMLAAGVAAWSLYLEADAPMPSIMAGHSLGEYTALVAAGCLGFQHAIEIVHTRGKLMQAAVPTGVGAMAAILGLSDEEVLEICANASTKGEVVEAVNFNSPGQVVISGHKIAVEKATLLAKDAGAKRALILPVSVPSHSSLMIEAAAQLSEKLASVEITTPNIPVLQNINGEAHNSPQAIREALVAQLHRPVLWVKTVENMKSTGVETLIEAGPGKVLTGLTKRIDKTLTAQFIADQASLNATLVAVNA